MSDQLVSLLSEITAHIDSLDLEDSTAASESLRTTFDTFAMQPITSELLRVHGLGELTPRQATPTLQFGRVAKPCEATHDQSIDAVDIRGAGAPHTHPRGEVSWCIPLEGTPSFEGAREGWVVLPPGSRHVPRVDDGRMLIVYFLPGGAVTWG